MLDELIVRFVWGDKEFPEVRLHEGEIVTFNTDGAMAYPLIQLDWDKNHLILKPRCLMIAASPELLRRYADILETK